MSKFTTKSNNRGFTLVELLIVIVIIAILAAISIVAYNGIQQRARNSRAAEAASQLSTKVEAWNGEKSAYPSATAVTSGLVDAAVPEAAVDDSLRGLIISGTAPTQQKPVAYEECSTTGARITYFVEGGSPDTKTLIRGTGC